MKTILKSILIVSILNNCVSADAPKMPRTPERYYGVKEFLAVCRMQGQQTVCIPADSDAFNNVVCLVVEDMQMVDEYVFRLNNQCLKWKK